MNIKSDPFDIMQDTNNKEIVVWDNAYTTGIPLIDEQHRELVSLTNQLYQACLTGTNDVGPAFKTSMARMVEYVRFHFTAELEILERVKFPAYADHKMQHDSLVKNILDAAKDFNTGKKFVPNTFVRTLKDWVFGHIAVSDKQYALYIAGQKRRGLLTDKQITG